MNQNTHATAATTSAATPKAPFLSRYTFHTAKSGSEDLVLVNYLTGAIDLVEAARKGEFLERYDNNRWENYSLTEYMLERGYLIRDSAREQDLLQEKYLEFQAEYDRTPVQLIFSVTYVCNFACSYCFQESYHQNKKSLTREITDGFFAHANRKFGAEEVRPYITLFGGEPLMGGESYRENLLYFLSKAKEYDYEVAIVTNGYELTNYLPHFQEMGARLKEIQVTVDGDREMHDSRRVTKGGEPTFDRVAEGIDQALKMGYRINLRTVIDRENIKSLPSLAEYAQKRGWLHYPSALFETTLGRNYELHSCQKGDTLFSRLEMWEEYEKMAKEHPLLRQYHKPQFHGIRYLSENGELPMAIFDGCPAGKKEWAFDLNGDIYGCTASVGVPQYRLGNFMEPGREEENEEQILQWQTRDVLSIPECESCAMSLSCGGGCGVLAANNNGGNIHSPDCRPVRELVGIGVSHYDIG